MKILGIKIDNLDKKEILEKIESFLRSDKFHQIATVNPEFILTAQKDKEFKNILNNCDLNIADGVGLKFAFWRCGQKLKARIAGVDLMWEILKIANDRGLSIFLAADKNGLSGWEETKDAILRKYPGLKISGKNINHACHSERSDSEVEESTCVKIRSLDYARDDSIKNYDIVFCNFGHPHQEKFIYSLKSQKYDNIKLAMGVGGSFDFATGKLRRAPLWVRKIGLEWLFRLIQQPKRIKRIFNAVIIFPVKIIFNKTL